MRNARKFIVGIDPDVEKSGVALLDTRNRSLVLRSLSFPELMDYLQSLTGNRDDYLVVVEGGWLNPSNFHLRGRGQHCAARQGNDVGRNQETGRKIVEMARHFSLETEVKRPLRKIWLHGKISREELEAFTGRVGRCSQDERDAALLAWDRAGFPMTVHSRTTFRTAMEDGEIF